MVNNKRTTIIYSILILSSIALILFLYYLKHFSSAANHIFLRGYLLLIFTLVLGCALSFDYRNTFQKTIAILLISIVLGFSLVSFGSWLIHPMWSGSPRDKEDYLINYMSSIELYENQHSPYEIHGLNLPPSISFPFPTYFLYWIFSGFGKLDFSQGAFLYWIANLILLIISFFLWVKLFDLDRDYFRKYWKRAVIFVFILLNALSWVVLSIGQSEIFIVFFVSFTLWSCYKSKQKWVLMLAGYGLSLAMMIKPHLSLFALYFAIAGIVILYSKRYKSNHFWILVGLIIGTLFSIVGTLVIPNGVSYDTYLQFLTKVTPVLKFRFHSIYNISPVVHLLTLSHIPVTSAISLLILIGLIAITWRATYRRMLDLDSNLLWLTCTTIAFPVVWFYYNAWVIPVQLFIYKELFEKDEIGSMLHIFFFLSFGLMLIDGGILPGIGTIILYFLLIKYRK